VRWLIGEIRKSCSDHEGEILDSSVIAEVIGADSLGMVEFVMHVEEEFDCPFSDDKFANFGHLTTVGELAEKIRESL